MRLRTMTLPTGEFIIVGSGVQPPLPRGESLSNLKAATGAAAVLILEQDVDIEDALVDENARRVETPLFAELEADLEASDPDKPWEPHTGDRVLLHGRSVYGTDVEGHEGTVVDESEPAGVGVKLDELIGHVHTVYIQPSQLELLPVKLDEAAPPLEVEKPYSQPQVGDRVRVVDPPDWSFRVTDDHFAGKTGKVIGALDPDGEVYVAFDDGTIRHAYFAPEQLVQLVEAGGDPVRYRIVDGAVMDTVFEKLLIVTGSDNALGWGDDEGFYLKIGPYWTALLAEEYYYLQALGERIRLRKREARS